MTYKEYREEDVLYIFELFMGHLKSKVLQGTVDSLDVAALTAVDVLVTDSGSTLAIDLEYLPIAGPNLVKSSANPDKVLSPVNSDTKPPLLGTSLAISANDLTAVEVFSTAVASTF